MFLETESRQNRRHTEQISGYRLKPWLGRWALKRFYKQREKKQIKGARGKSQDLFGEYNCQVLTPVAKTETEGKQRQKREHCK